MGTWTKNATALQSMLDDIGEILKCGDGIKADCYIFNSMY